jgi:hypothetical protein
VPLLIEFERDPQSRIHEVELLGHDGERRPIEISITPIEGLGRATGGPFGPLRAREQQ